MCSISRHHVSPIRFPITERPSMQHMLRNHCSRVPDLSTGRNFATRPNPRVGWVGLQIDPRYGRTRVYWQTNSRMVNTFALLSLSVRFLELRTSPGESYYGLSTLCRRPGYKTTTTTNGKRMAEKAACMTSKPKPEWSIDSTRREPKGIKYRLFHNN
jgi:hypothetical protein